MLKNIFVKFGAFKIKKLKKIGVAEDTRGGDDDTSRLVLLPLQYLFGDV